jgi:hypothetical protein
MERSRSTEEQARAVVAQIPRVSGMREGWAG